MKIIGAEHTSYTVSNLERSLEFYVGLLGCELLWQRVNSSQYLSDVTGFSNCTIKQAYLRIPGSETRLELFEYVTPQGTPADIRTNNTGSSHMAFLVDDLPAAYEELKAKGVRFRSPPVPIDSGANKGGYDTYMLDPDGITMELFQPPQGHGGTGGE